LRTEFVTKNHFKAVKKSRKITHRKYFHWTLISMSNAGKVFTGKLLFLERKYSSIWG